MKDITGKGQTEESRYRLNEHTSESTQSTHDSVFIFTLAPSRHQAPTVFSWLKVFSPLRHFVKRAAADSESSCLSPPPPLLLPCLASVTQ